MEQLQRIFTTVKAAAYVNLSMKTFRKHRNAGRVKCLGTDGTIFYFTQPDLDEFRNVLDAEPTKRGRPKKQLPQIAMPTV